MSALAQVAGRGARLGMPVAPALAALVLALWAVAVAAPGLLVAADPDATDVVAALRPPGGAHPFGTDELGRDVLSRVVHGARLSLTIGFGATALGVAGGLLLGLLAASGGRRLDQLVMRVQDVLLAFPELLLALLVVTVVGSGTGNVLVAIGVAAVPTYARLVRGQALTVIRSGYVEAAAALGVRRPLVVVRHVLPNVAGPLLVLATIGTGTAVISGSALSFLGLGAAPPAAEWGAMLSDGREFLATAWWTATFPGLAIVSVVLSVTVLGRHLQGRSTRGEGRP
ncbi:ABC transporter permease [Streptomyces fulvoviolaceus]|uniref:ABC transporter permease n=1 Tax=Streptomyces fulvoviolaceus TaxID=285535 RepID=UPI0021C1A959|nr:ABC transporter permease [Streptomyces fulvoviolaceus]MCT9084548.1 ABC transporter permease [Streptomyces fulvoviolaceus]